MLYVIVGLIALVVLAGSLVFFLDFLNDNFIYVLILAVILAVWNLKTKRG